MLNSVIEKYEQKNSLILLSAIFLILVTFFIEKIFLIIALLAAGIILLLLKKEILIYISIIALLVLVSDLNPSIRIISNIIIFSFLGFQFIKKYGFEFNKYPQIPKSLTVFVILLLTGMLISSIFSEYVLIGFNQTIKQIIFFWLVYIFYSLIELKSDLLNYLNALFIAGVLASISIILTFFQAQQNTVTNADFILRTGGFYESINAVAILLIVSISINIYKLFSASQKSFLVVGFLLVVQFTALAINNSRASILGVAVSIFFILYKLNKNILKKILITMISFSALIFALFYEPVLNFINLYFRTGRALENTRYSLWEIAVGIIKDQPIFGIGPGSFRYYLYKYLPIEFGSWNETQIRYMAEVNGTGYAANLFLQLTADMGILGFLAAFLLHLTFFYFAKAVIYQYKNNPLYYKIAVTVTGIVTGLLIRGLFEGNGILTYGFITRDLPFWICFAVLIYLYQNKDLKVSKVN